VTVTGRGDAHSAEHVATLHDEGVQVVINLCEEREYWVGERERC
jgi:hypothetical protein